MKYIKLKKKGKTILFYFKKIELGNAYREVDGFYVFEFKQIQGCWSDYVLREIADILTDLNREYHKKINELLFVHST